MSGVGQGHTLDAKLDESSMSQSACVIVSIESSEPAIGVMSGNRWK